MEQQWINFLPIYAFCKAIRCGPFETQGSDFVPVSEEAGIKVQPWFLPPDVEVEGEGDTEICVTNLEDVWNMDFNAYVGSLGDLKSMTIQTNYQPEEIELIAP